MMTAGDIVLIVGLFVATLGAAYLLLGSQRR
jgi:hypothetical protein